MEKHRKEAKRLIKQLAQYCHHKQCRALDKCPESHKACRQKLDLDTAIAWRVKWVLEEMICLRTFQLTKSELLNALECSIRDIEIYCNIVNLHRDQYRALYDLVGYTYRLVRAAWNAIRRRQKNDDSDNLTF